MTTKHLRFRKGIQNGWYRITYGEKHWGSAEVTPSGIVRVWKGSGKRGEPRKFNSLLDAQAWAAREAHGASGDGVSS